MVRIGIDVGGTHTDGVVLDQQGNIITYCKTTTTEGLVEGVKLILKQLLVQANIQPKEITMVVMGTTYATNAILECKGLLKVGLLRLIDGKPKYPSPGFGWPSELKQVIASHETCEGGYECDGRESTRFNLAEVREAIYRLLGNGAESISVVGSFSPLNGGQENEVELLIKEIAGDQFPISLSHQIGGIGFLERENAAILNSALKKEIYEGFRSMELALTELKIDAPLWLTENRGSLLSLREAIHFPIKTIGAGPTNSFIGAAKLCRLQDAIVVDVGGTSTDIGIIEGGYARTSMQAAAIGGVSLHFAMPDMISLGIGGGSHVHLSEAEIQIGPKSVSKQLHKQSRVFGGPILTLTDTGVALGLLKLGHDFNSPGISRSDAQKVMKKVSNEIYRSIVRIRGKRTQYPVIAVGGGALLLENLFREYDLKGQRPMEAGEVANAYGAGRAEISGVIDRVVSLKEREKVIEKLKEEACNVAVAKGAISNQVRIACISILPFAYTSDALAKVVITASGPI